MSKKKKFNLCCRTFLILIVGTSLFFIPPPPPRFNKGSFLRNSRFVDFGSRQCGRAVGDVELPPWARGDPARAVELLRAALEGERASRSLHRWVDLVFGYRQRGREAERADNVFYHLCYEGEVGRQIPIFPPPPHLSGKPALPAALVK